MPSKPTKLDLLLDHNRMPRDNGIPQAGRGGLPEPGGMGEKQHWNPFTNLSDEQMQDYAGAGTGVLTSAVGALTDQGQYRATSGGNAIGTGIGTGLGALVGMPGLGGMAGSAIGKIIGQGIDNRHMNEAEYQRQLKQYGNLNITANLNPYGNSYQKGGATRAPLPGTPAQIKAYNDSLVLAQKNQPVLKQLKELLTNKPSGPVSFAEFNIEPFDNTRSYIGYKDDQSIKPIAFADRLSSNQGASGLARALYKMPVQPYVSGNTKTKVTDEFVADLNKKYQGAPVHFTKTVAPIKPKPPLQRTTDIPIANTALPPVSGVTLMGNVQAPHQQPTDYQFNYPNDTGQMQSIYFNSLKEYQDALSVAGEDQPGEGGKTWGTRGRNNIRESVQKGNKYSSLFNYAPNYQHGGLTNTGYLNDSPDRFNDYNIIPGGLITMDNVNRNIMAYPDKGKPKLLKSNSGLHRFPGAGQVTEIPVAQKGGQTIDPRLLALQQMGSNESVATGTPQLIAPAMPVKEQPAFRQGRPNTPAQEASRIAKNKQYALNQGNNVDEQGNIVNSPLNRLANNKTFVAAADNIVLPMAEAYAGGGEQIAKFLGKGLLKIIGKGSLTQQAKHLINSGVVKGFSGDALKDAANVNYKKLKPYLENIMEQSRDAGSSIATTNTYGQPLVDVANKMYPYQKINKEDMEMLKLATAAPAEGAHTATEKAQQDLWNKYFDAHGGYEGDLSKAIWQFTRDPAYDEKAFQSAALKNYNTSKKSAEQLIGKIKAKGMVDFSSLAMTKAQEDDLLDLMVKRIEPHMDKLDDIESGEAWKHPGSEEFYKANKAIKKDIGEENMLQNMGVAHVQHKMVPGRILYVDENGTKEDMIKRALRPQDARQWFGVSKDPNDIFAGPNYPYTAAIDPKEAIRINASRKDAGKVFSKDHVPVKAVFNPDSRSARFNRKGGLVAGPQQLNNLSMHNHFQEGGYTESSPQPPQEGQEQQTTRINIEKGELMIDPSSPGYDIVRDFCNSNRFSAHEKNQYNEPMGNFVDLPSDMVIVPKKLAPRYRNGDVLTRRSILLQILSDQKDDPMHNVPEEQQPEGYDASTAQQQPQIPDAGEQEMAQAAKGGWIKGAVNPAHKGYCTPITKSTCTPKRKAFAMTMKKHHGFHHRQGGFVHQYQAGGGIPFGPRRDISGINTMPPRDVYPANYLQQFMGIAPDDPYATKPILNPGVPPLTSANGRFRPNPWTIPTPQADAGREANTFQFRDPMGDQPYQDQMIPGNGGTNSQPQGRNWNLIGRQAMQMLPIFQQMATNLQGDPDLHHHPNTGINTSMGLASQLPEEVSIASGLAANDRSYALAAGTTREGGPGGRSERAAMLGSKIEGDNQLYGNKAVADAQLKSTKLNSLMQLAGAQGSDFQTDSRQYDLESAQNKGIRDNNFSAALANAVKTKSEMGNDAETIRVLNAVTHFSDVDPMAKQLFRDDPGAKMYIIEQMLGNSTLDSRTAVLRYLQLTGGKVPADKEDETRTTKYNIDKNNKKILGTKIDSKTYG